MVILVSALKGLDTFSRRIYQEEKEDINAEEMLSISKRTKGDMRLSWTVTLMDDS
jgi:hypothetical protein